MNQTTTLLRAAVRSLAALAFAAQAIACATTISVPRMRPAEVNLAGYTRVAVTTITGNGGLELTDELAANLVSTKRYEVLDRKHLDQVMQEQHFQISGAVSDESAVSVGQLIGAAALIVGNVTAYDYREDLSNQHKTCKDGKKERPCTHYTRSAKAAIDVALKVVDTTSGKVLAAKNLTGATEDSRTTIDSPPAEFNAREEWLANLRKQVSADFMRVIAPYEVIERVELKDDSDLPDLEMGNNFAKLGNWQQAIAKYKAAVDAAEQNPDLKNKVKAKARYNLGVGLAYSGQYDAGIAEIEQAYALDPADLYLGEVNRIKRYKADDAELEVQKKGAQESPNT